VTWLIHTCDVTHSYMWHDSIICVKWLIHICDMTHSYVWCDSFIYGTRLNRICNMTHCCVGTMSLSSLRPLKMAVCVTWLIRMYDMTHLYQWHDSFMCVTWLIAVRAQCLGSILNLLKGQPKWHKIVSLCGIYKCDMTYHMPNMTRWSVGTMCWLSIGPTWLIHMCDVTHSYVWHDSFLYLTSLVPAWLRGHFILVIQETSWNGSLCAMTLSYAWHDESFIGHAPAEK